MSGRVGEIAQLGGRTGPSPAKGSSRRSARKIAFSLAIAAALLAFFLWRAPLGEVGASLAAVHGGWVLAAVGLALLSYALRGLRWGVILQPVGKAPAGALLGCTAAGFAASTILPGRLGELVRPLLLARRTGLPAAGALASILTERLIDLATLLAVFAGGVLAASDRVTPAAAPGLRRAALLAAAGLVLAFVAILVLLHMRRAAVSRLTRLAPARWQERLRNFLEHLLDGLEAVRSRRGLVLLVLWSIAVWGVAILQIVALARAFDLSLGIARAAILIGVSVIGLALPTPGGVGSFHAAIQFALTSLLGAELAAATAFALLHHAICFFPITAAGLAYLGAVGLRPAAAAALTVSPEE